MSRRNFPCHFHFEAIVGTTLLNLPMNFMLEKYLCLVIKVEQLFRIQNLPVLTRDNLLQATDHAKSLR